MILEGSALLLGKNIFSLRINFYICIGVQEWSVWNAVGLLRGDGIQSVSFSAGLKFQAYS